MQKKLIFGLLLGFLLIVVSSTQVGAVAELCERVDQKPVLSPQPLRQHEFVHLMVVISGLQPPSPEGKTPEQYYEEEVQLLIDNGFPPGLAQVEPNRIVTRRYFASMMYPIAVAQDSEFAARYGGLTDETQQANALMEAEYMYSDEENIYRQEVQSVLCTKGLRITPPQAEAVVVKPIQQKEANTEVPVSEP